VNRSINNNADLDGPGMWCCISITFYLGPEVGSRSKVIVHS